jgi:hypothetical protein
MVALAAARVGVVIRFFIALAACLITVAGAAVLLRHEIIGTQSGFYDHDRWTGRVIACVLVTAPHEYFTQVKELISAHPPEDPPQGWTKEEWQKYLHTFDLPPGKQLPSAEDILGPKPLSLAEANAAAIVNLGDYFYCAPRPAEPAPRPVSCRLLADTERRCIATGARARSRSSRRSADGMSSGRDAGSRPPVGCRQSRRRALGHAK